MLHNVWELRMRVLALFFCVDRPGLFPQLSHEHDVYWIEMHALSSRGLTDADWGNPELENIDSRRILTDEEFAAWIDRARNLRIAVRG